MRRMINFPPILVMLLVLITLSTGCRSTPISQRKQLVLIPESQEINMGAQAYQQVKAEETISSHAELQAMVERVGKRIAAVSGRSDFAWEFTLFESPQVNAFALPGGKVAIYEGILPVCQNEAGLAVVMSHEIAHALARHGGERMTQQGIANVGSTVVRVFSKDQPAEQQAKYLEYYGAASQYGALLPFSRKHESEADEIGLMLMAKAGYDPQEAPKFWQRFAAVNSQSTPEFLSTHPSDSRRAADLQALLPKAMEYYVDAAAKHSLGEPIVLHQKSGRSDRLKEFMGESPSIIQTDFQATSTPSEMQMSMPAIHEEPAKNPVENDPFFKKEDLLKSLAPESTSQTSDSQAPFPEVIPKEMNQLPAPTVTASTEPPPLPMIQAQKPVRQPLNNEIDNAFLPPPNRAKRTAEIAANPWPSEITETKASSSEIFPETDLFEMPSESNSQDDSSWESADQLEFEMPLESPPTNE